MPIIYTIISYHIDYRLILDSSHIHIIDIVPYIIDIDIILILDSMISYMVYHHSILTIDLIII